MECQELAPVLSRVGLVLQYHKDWLTFPLSIKSPAAPSRVGPAGHDHSKGSKASSNFETARFWPCTLPQRYHIQHTGLLLAPILSLCIILLVAARWRRIKLARHFSKNTIRCCLNILQIQSFYPQTIIWENNFCEPPGNVYDFIGCFQESGTFSRQSCSPLGCWTPFGESLHTKIILHRIISVVWLTSFLSETWSFSIHDDETKFHILSVKPLRQLTVVWTLMIAHCTLLCSDGGETVWVAFPIHHKQNIAWLIDPSVDWKYLWRKQRKTNKSQQHPVFPGGLPSKY